MSYAPADTFAHRHLGPDAAQTASMLAALGLPDLDTLIDTAVPEDIRLRRPLAFQHLPEPLGESAALARLRSTMSRNQLLRNFIGQGYQTAVMPPVILRNILENPGWYTGYTPYQAEISQGRLEMLLHFQTLVIELTALPVANASLLDEGTAAAEAMTLAWAARRNPAARVLFVADSNHPQTLAVLATRALPLGIEIETGPLHAFVPSPRHFALVAAYPATDGSLPDLAPALAAARAAGLLSIVASDLLALVLLTPPGELGADIAIGSTQRLGLPLGFGGPHAAYMAVRDDLKRRMPGRLIGVSRDSKGRPGLRLSLQTREQHIRRDKATSNICTAQVLLAVLSAAYAIYHGPDGLRAILTRIHRLALLLAAGLRRLGYTLPDAPFLDTLRVPLRHGPVTTAPYLLHLARLSGFNLRQLDETTVAVALDEPSTTDEIHALLQAFNHAQPLPFTLDDLDRDLADLPDPAQPRFRASPILTPEIFHRHHTETEMLRLLKRLENKDLTLTGAIIPLGSCTMKLNATTQMLPLSWPEVSSLHPFAPADQTQGYQQMAHELSSWLTEITGFPAISLQPNAGSQGEYAGLLAIRAHHHAQGQPHRTICLIPLSAHGTNPASAVMAGFTVVPVACDSQGNIDLPDLRAKTDLHAPNLAALMVTYPSTHGVFEESIAEICRIIHHAGGKVYMDGANLNAQVGLCRPADFGADVCHLNLHKTFCIPHGGGGPGVGPIGLTAELAPYLPSENIADTHAPVGPVTSAPLGSASILVISWAYIAMMGAPGLTHATKLAILSANYIARRLAPHYPVLYTGRGGLVAHECILDLRHLPATSGVTVEDVAKRLMDYGIHAPTMSWPVAGTLMIEPTESETQTEMDRLCDALIAIRQEIAAIENGQSDRDDNPLKNAPHPAEDLLAETWPHPYPRHQAAYPVPGLRHHKYWPPVSRIDNVHGDRNLVCSCLGMDEYGGAPA